LNFTWESLEAAQNAFEKLKDFVINLKDQSRSDVLIHSNKKIIDQFKKKFLNYINNDLEMPSALALLWDAIKSEKLNPKTKCDLIIDFDKVFGLNLSKIKIEKIPAAILKLTKEREKYRQEKNFKKADEFRKKIESFGWLVEDSPSGPKLKKN